MKISLVVIATFLAVGASVPTDKRRPKDLSDEKHYVGDVNKDHNADYDHDAFLGSEEAQTFDQLPPGEAKRRLGVIVERIDTNGDGGVTEQELKEWVRHVARRYVVITPLVTKHWWGKASCNFEIKIRTSTRT